MIAVADGEMSLEQFATEHVDLSGPSASQGQALVELMGRAMAEMVQAQR